MKQRHLISKTTAAFLAATLALSACSDNEHDQSIGTISDAENAEIDAYIQHIKSLEQKFPPVKAGENFVRVDVVEQPQAGFHGAALEVRTLLLTACSENIQEDLSNFVIAGMTRSTQRDLDKRGHFSMRISVAGAQPAEVFNDVLDDDNSYQLLDVVKKYGAFLEQQMGPQLVIYNNSNALIEAPECFEA